MRIPNRGVYGNPYNLASVAFYPIVGRSALRVPWHTRLIRGELGRTLRCVRIGLQQAANCTEMQFRVRDARSLTRLNRPEHQTPRTMLGWAPNYSSGQEVTMVSPIDLRICVVQCFSRL